MNKDQSKTCCYQIAIDGYSGVGKTTCGQKLAKQLGWLFIDTGIMFRAFTYHCLVQKVDFTQSSEIIQAIKNFDFQFLKNHNFFMINNLHIKVSVLFGKNILDNINTISCMQQVRSYLKTLQQNITLNNNVVMVGRDIGTVVLPNADVKFFLTATLEERATRRYYQKFSKTTPIDSVLFIKVRNALAERDQNDTTRSIAPLKPDHDSIIIDNTNYMLEETVGRCYTIICQKIKL